VKNSLTQVEHQIWLLRNVFWWYLLPFTFAILVFFAHVAWSLSENWLVALGVATPFFVFLLALYSFIDYINQRAVRCDLEPRRQELLALLASLGGDDSAEEHASKSSQQNVESSGVLRRWLIVTLLTFVTFVVMVLALASEITDSSYDGPPQSSGPAGDSLAELVTDQRKEKNLVGLAAMVTVDGEVEAAAAHGERKKGSGVPLEIDDRWHLGGITKSITATMIARLIESGRMQWTATVGEIFPEAAVHGDWKPVTLRQLLTATAGAPPNFPNDVLRQRPALGPECTQARREAVLNVIAEKPAHPPGKKYAYSNVGYTIAGAMAEKVTGATWEDLVKREVFEPLELSEAGFGPPKSADETLEQPRGHRTRLAGKVPVDDTADNTPIMGPSGIVHMSLRDLCTYAEEHLRGELGTGTLLSTETNKLLHTPALHDYACGWSVKEPSYDIPHTVYSHNGSNTMWYALVVFIPDKNMVVAVTSNDGDFDQTEAAAWEIVKASANQFNVESDAERRKSLPSEAFPKKSPFAAVRWQQSQPEVKVGDEWFKLVSLDEIPASEIVAFSQRTYGNKWQKRFEEDLVELLTRMGHPPLDTVTLVVRSLTSSETRNLEDVPMTRDNRRAIRDAAQARERSGQPQGTRRAVPIEDAELFRARIDEFLSAVRLKASFSGAVIVARGGQP
jgi:CubicO group peptidase (beta-lactamase class C family)